MNSNSCFTPVRLAGNPIIRPGMDAGLGDNINGPSLIRVPEWITAPLGRYYLYFAHHHGRNIRMAYADELCGPWKILEGGTLQLEETPVRRWSYRAHIASPDVHVENDTRRIVMFYHGGYRLMRPRQATYAATSSDGLRFNSSKQRFGRPYWRRFRWDGDFYAIVMGGQLYRSSDPLGGYEPGPILPLPAARHLAVWVEHDRLHLFFSRVGDAPERILACTVELSGDWRGWQLSKESTLLFPKEIYEGVNLPVGISRYGAVYELVRQLRDPYVFREGGELYMLYAVGGESGIAIARLDPAHA